jgi:D-glycero-D-manno-heptose 1,7-bisphosphate phosphatase
LSNEVSRGASDRVIVLDRDGTLVLDRGYLEDPAGLEWTEGALQALLWWRAHGYRLVVVTNQSGVGRGLFAAERVEAVHAGLRTMARAAGVELAGIYYCPHHPDDHCRCRKPEPGLLYAAAAEHGFDPGCSVVIGDKESDVELGMRVGAKTILIREDARGALEPGCTHPHLIAPSLLAAAHEVTQRGW